MSSESCSDKKVADHLQQKVTGSDPLCIICISLFHILFLCLGLQRVDTTARAVMDIMTKTTEYLQPNPATRAKMSMMNSMSRMRGQEKGPGYTQTETILAESMQRFGRELGEDSTFGLALIDAGEAMRELGEVKDALDMEVKQNFIDPMQNLHDKDLKEIQHHLKKLEGRRLDFDYKKKRQAKVTEDELKQALEKFDDSKEVAEQSMFNLLESDIEQVSQLAALVHAQVQYHTRSAEILTQLSSKIDERIREISNKPRKDFMPKPRTSLDLSISENYNGGIHGARSPGETRLLKRIFNVSGHMETQNPDSKFYIFFFIFNFLSIFNPYFHIFITNIQVKTSI
ncbi:Endophilin-A1 [Characodon lateralis]|uniref:Endophilin-A1 n=1 Tax=Characodon lateralis TaxID=208331 RepID=A0ABU7EW25_9TELE|nr:Endophilin-A1 [Characodon lateralis]